MSTDVARCRVTVAGPIADAVLGALRARFDVESVEVRGGRTELVAARVDQAAQRALLTLLWDTGHAVRTVAFMAEVALRPIVDADLDVLFDQMRDPEAVRMAAFTAQDPGDRAEFDAHMAKVRALPDAVNRAITLDGRLVGSIACFVVGGDTEITYWIGRAFWGQGIAGRAVELFLRSVPVRPVHARAASDNAGSLKVLQRAGFVVVGTATGFANARGAEIGETILRLDEPSR